MNAQVQLFGFLAIVLTVHCIHEVMSRRRMWTRV
jgi:hypothetical protein